MPQPRAVLIVPTDARPGRALPRGLVFMLHFAADVQVPARVVLGIHPAHLQVVVWPFVLGPIFPIA